MFIGLHNIAGARSVLSEGGKFCSGEQRGGLAMLFWSCGDGDESVERKPRVRPGS